MYQLALATISSGFSLARKVGDHPLCRRRLAVEVTGLAQRVTVASRAENVCLAATCV
jgi:hypothetical protein